MGWIIAIIVGGIAGWLASMVMARDASMGILWNIIVGIIGAIVGGWIAAAVGVGTATWLSWFIFAIIGGIVLVALMKLLQGGRLR